MEWTDIRLTVAKADAENAEAVATLIAEGGIYIEDYSDIEQQVAEIAHVDLIEQELLDKPRDTVIIHLYLEPGASQVETLALIAARMEAAGIPYTVETEGVEQEDWQNGWRKYYHPMEIGSRLAVVPSWQQYDTDRVKLILDPGLAFGTGGHETTSLCLEALDEQVRGGERVLDIGTGSGILAIAALKLGAASAEGVDIDPVAVRTAGENAALNGVQDKLTMLDSDGVLTEKPGNCHMVWNRDTRCENCISAKAYARKTILNKIEFKDEKAYFVISKYIEVGGRGCILEMVTRLTDGRWLDMGGHRLLLDRCDGMERSAFVDPLTGAYTRRYFDKFLAGGEMHGGGAMIDVNQFKSVNDSFGHLVGDEALQTVAAAMQSCLRQTDILIRYGGDEFLLLMPQNCPDDVESVVRRVQNAVQAARVPSHPELRLSVSIGGVCNVQPLTEAIRQADARMYCNKENGEQVL